MWAIIPVKRLNLAKRRLADVLAPDERRELVLSMLQDVLRNLTQCRFITGASIVSSDTSLRTQAAAFGVEYLSENEQDLNAAMRQGAAYARSRGLEEVVLLPADVPLITAEEMDSWVAGRAREPGINIVSDRAGDGTNGLLVSPPELIDFHYGPGSFSLHCQAARAAGARVTEDDIPSLRLDIDTVADLERLLNSRASTTTHAFIDSIGLAARLAERHNV